MSAEERDAAAATAASLTVNVADSEIPPGSPLDSSTLLSSVPIDPFAYQCALVDLNLLSGSSERMRNALGGYFTTEIDDRGLLPVPPKFIKFNPFYNPHPDIGSIQTFSMNESVVSNTALERGFGQGYSSLQQTIIPSNAFVCRVEGDPSQSPNLNNVLNASKYWEILFTGGNYLDSYMAPMYNTGTYDDHYTVIRTPYKAMERNYLKNYTAVTEFVEASYEYNRYFRKYQNFASQIESERRLPNWYMYNIMGLLPYVATGRPQSASRLRHSRLTLEQMSFAKTLVQDFNYQYYTFGEKYDLIEMDRFVTTMNEVDEETGNIITKNTPSWQLPGTTEYINEIIPSGYDLIPTNIINKFDERNRNLIFDARSTALLLDKESEMSEVSAAWPYYNKLSVDLNSSNILYRSLMQDDSNDTSALVMRTIKEVFLEQADLVPLQHMQFQKTSLYMSGTLGTTEDLPATKNEMVEYKSADFVKMLLYAYQNVQMSHEDFQVVGFSSLESKAVMDTRGLYRALNSKNAAKLINEVLNLFGTINSATKITNVASLLNSQDSDIPTVEDIETLNPAPKYNEVIAFRVEKIGGDVQGDSNTQQVIQNFWIFNNKDMNSFELLDSQVKYDTDYTYKIYAYYLVRGYKYKYSNLQLSRIIGQVREDGYAGPLELASGLDGGPPTPPTAYCVEYYDPYTQNVSNDFLENVPAMTNVDNIEIDKMSTVATDAQRIAASSYTDDTGNVLPPYVANFQMTVQPSLRLIQVPYVDKAYRVLDHPPNQLDVQPGYTLLNNNMITFDLSYQGHSPAPYPRPITENDIAVEARYLKANDILSTTRVQKETVSPQRFVEVYRLAHKPESFRDFENVTPKSVELAIEGTEFSYTTAIFNDTIKSNHKYYYLFRVLNTNGVAGNVNTIIEAELVNDGGYKYGTFEVLFEEDLMKEDFDKASTSFKNIFQLRPNMNQLTLNTEASNYDNRATEEYENVKVGSANDLIWGKTFKIRLTSKKTGKKIDLNITYSDPDINLPRK